MTISTKPDDIDNPEAILHYMDEFPGSGQNRATAKLIRELLSIPASSKLDEILNSYRNGDRGLPTYDELMSTASSAPLPTDLCDRIKERTFSDYPQFDRETGSNMAIGWNACRDMMLDLIKHLPVAGPLIAASDSKVPRKGLLWDSQWSNIVNHDHSYENFSKEDAVHHAVKLTEERIAKNLAGQVAPQATVCKRCDGEGITHTGIWESPTTQCSKCDGTGIAEPQATVEPLTDAMLAAEWEGYRNGLTASCNLRPKMPFGAEGANALESIRSQIVELIAATPPTSKATEPAYKAAFDDAMLRGTGMLKMSADGVEHIPFDEFMLPVSTSKADTVDRNAVLEEIAEWIEPQREYIPATGAEFASAIRALKSATPSTIKEELTAPAYTTGHCEAKKQKGGCPHHNVHCGYPNCDRRPTGEQL